MTQILAKIATIYFPWTPTRFRVLFLKKYFWIFCVFSLICKSHSVNADSEYFFSKPSMISAKLSPSGKYVAAIKNRADTQQLVVIDTESYQESDLLDISTIADRNGQIKSLFWLDDEFIATQFSEIKRGVNNLLDTQKKSSLLIVKKPESDKQSAEIYIVKTKGWLVDPLIKQKNTFLYAKTGIQSKVYKLKVSKLGRYGQKFNKLTKRDGGQFIKDNEVASIEGFAFRWFIDLQGSPVAALHLDSESIKLSQLEEGVAPELVTSWRRDEFGEPQNDNEITQRLIPLALADDENTYYSLDYGEDNERSIYKVNYRKGSHQLVYEADSFEIVDLIQSDTNNRLVGVKLLQSGELHNAYIDQSGIYTTDEDLSLNGELVSLIGSNRDRSQLLYYLEDHNQPGVFFLKDARRNSRKKIGGLYPHLNGNLNSTLMQGKVSVEGLEIPYLLSLPENREGPFPLLVMPHGGPIGIFDNRYFDLATQYMVQQGFAVLRINFRGSGGYTSALKEAGKKQWGNLMLTDIHMASLAVSQRTDIDSNRVCVVGASYGGYAATMLTLNYPDFYKCGVNIAGVSDINLMLNSPYLTARQDTWLKEYVGDSSSDYDELKKISPAYLVNRLQRPLLIVHGAKDRVVDIEHAYRLKYALERFNKPFEWHIFPEGDHSLAKPKQAEFLFSKVTAFVQKHL